eukprot:Opistho-2@61769
MDDWINFFLSRKTLLKILEMILSIITFAVVVSYKKTCTACSYDYTSLDSPCGLISGDSQWVSSAKFIVAVGVVGMVSAMAFLIAYGVIESNQVLLLSSILFTGLWFGIYVIASCFWAVTLTAIDKHDKIGTCFPPDLTNYKVGLAFGFMNCVVWLADFIFLAVNARHELETISKMSSGSSSPRTEVVSAAQSTRGTVSEATASRIQQEPIYDTGSQA